MNIENENWRERFDEKIDLEGHSENFKWLQEESLFGDDKHPESDYELSAEKIKSFIKQVLEDYKAEVERRLAEIPRIEIPLKDGSKTKAILEHSLRQITLK